MTTEILLVKTQENNVVVFNIEYANTAERARLQHQCELLCENGNYTNPSMAGISYDEKNTLFLQEEIFGYHFNKNRDNFQNNILVEAETENNTLYLPHGLDDEFFPELMKSLGYKIVPDDKSYDIEYNAANGNYEIVNFYDSVASIDNDAYSLAIRRNHFKFLPSDYAKLQVMMNSFLAAKAANSNLDVYDYMSNRIADAKDAALFKIYADEYTRIQHLNSTLVHELKHVKNDMFLKAMSLKKDAKRLSVEDCYRLGVEDERSAYLSQVICGINKYLAGGNYSDYSMFDRFSSDFVQQLQSCNDDAQRVAFASNLNAVVDYAIKKFNVNHKDSYDSGQFINITKYMAKQQSVTAPSDSDRTWFKKLRSLYYNFEVYDLATGRMQFKNLAQYIAPDNEVLITPEIDGMIIEPAKQVLQQKINKISTQITRNEVNPSLVTAAKSLMRDNLRNAKFINQIDGFSVSRLYDDVLPADGEQLPVQPQIPSDKASWSDGLKAYWQNTDGYEELAKNNLEYKFKINNAMVSYSAPDKVKISTNAEFNIYMKALKEPSTKNMPVEFLNTLSREQALMLYVACINCGRKPVGNVPQDLSGIEKFSGIPLPELQKFQYRNSGGKQQKQQTAAEKAVLFRGLGGR